MDECKKHTIHVTSVGNCKRQLYHKVHGNEKLPYHMYSVKGIMTHSAIEASLKGDQDITVEYPGLLKGRDDIDKVPHEAYNACLPEAKRCLDNFQRWAGSTNLDLEEFTSERTLNMPVKHKRRLGVVAADGHEFELTGTPDAYTEDKLIDFKTGKRVQDGNLKQLGAYAWMLETLELARPKDFRIILLGGEEPKEEIITPKRIEKQAGLFKSLLNDHLEEIIKITDSDYVPACALSYMCVMCEFNGNPCRGY